MSNLQRSLFCSITAFLHYSTTTKLLPPMILSLGLVPPASLPARASDTSAAKVKGVGILCNAGCDPRGEIKAKSEAMVLNIAGGGVEMQGRMRIMRVRRG
jgi:hypothetical protein